MNVDGRLWAYDAVFFSLEKNVYDPKTVSFLWSGKYLIDFSDV